MHGLLICVSGCKINGPIDAIDLIIISQRCAFREWHQFALFLLYHTIILQCATNITIYVILYAQLQFSIYICLIAQSCLCTAATKVVFNSNSLHGLTLKPLQVLTLEHEEWLGWKMYHHTIHKECATSTRSVVEFRQLLMNALYHYHGNVLLHVYNIKST